MGGFGWEEAPGAGISVKHRRLERMVGGCFYSWVNSRVCSGLEAFQKTPMPRTVIT